MRMATIAALLIPVFASADDVKSWKVPDGVRLTTARCDGGDLTVCLHLGWDAEAGGGDVDETSHERLTHARNWFINACIIAKQPSCPNADRVKAKLDKVDAIKEQRDKDLFYCGDAMDSAKLRVPGNKSQRVVMIRNCLTLVPTSFRDAVSSMAKMTVAQRQEHVLEAGLDSLCPTLKVKPAACSSKVKDLIPALQKKYSSEILGAAFGGELSTRGADINGFLIAN